MTRFVRGRRSGAWLLAAALALACGPKADTPREPEPRPTVALADATTSQLLAAVGDKAVAVLILHEDGWDELRASTQRADFGRWGAMARDMAAADSPLGLVATLGQGLGVDLAPIVAELPSRDPSRPIVVSLMEPPHVGPPGAALGMMVQADPMHAPARHQVLIPAKDVASLVAELHRGLDAVASEASDIVAGREGAFAFEVPVEGASTTYIAVLPEQDFVRVVVADRTMGMSVEDLQRCFDVMPASIPDTPAVRAVGGGAPLAVYLRPWQLRPYGVWEGLWHGQVATEMAPADQQHLARARALGVVSAVPVMTPDDSAEFDDWAMTVRAQGDAVSMALVASLTESGRKTWRAAKVAAASPLGLRREVAGHTYWRGNVSEMLEAASRHELPPWTPGQLLEAQQMCGDWCWSFAALRWPVAAIKTATGFEDGIRDSAEAGLSSIQLAWLDSNEPSKTWAAAIAGKEARQQDLGAWALLLSGETDLEFHEADRGGLNVLLVGRGVDPREVFDTQTDAPQLDAVAFARSEPGLFDSPVPLAAKVRLSGRALVGEALIGDKDLPKGPDYPDMDWTSMTRESTEQGRCLADMVRRTHTQLLAATASARDDYPRLFGGLVADLEEPGKCASSAPMLAKVVDKLTDEITLIGARNTLDALHIDEARELLSRRCEATRGKGATCDALADLGSFATPQIIERERQGRCLGTDYDGVIGVPVVYAEGSLLVGGRSVEAQPDAIINAVVASLPMGDRADGSAPTVGLVASPEATMKELWPIFEAFGSMGGSVRAIVQGARAPRLVPTPARVETREVDWQVADTYVAPDYGLAEEPPPPEPESNPEPAELEEGKMGAPSPKSKEGLYAMKGPNDAVPQLGGDGTAGGVPLRFRLTKAGLTLTRPGVGTSNVSPVTSVGDVIHELEEDLPPGQGFASTIEIADDVTWSEYLDVAVASCKTPLVLVKP